MRTMQNNITKISERGERLDNLQDKTDHLSTQANSFRRGANRVRKQMWWKDMKMRICIIVGVIILLVVIIVPSGKHLSLSPSSVPYFLRRNSSETEIHQSTRERYRSQSADERPSVSTVVAANNKNHSR